MSGKGSISRMSDECLMTLEFGFPFYTQYQAVMRKFTLAGKAKTGGATGFGVIISFIYASNYGFSFLLFFG